ncbi:MAG: hypothetical protein HY698_14680 [Deltaproteobacteria bacterium]|nr:hypothetical protein [Deltaproteobacteria bacterium]
MRAHSWLARIALVAMLGCGPEAETLSASVRLLVDEACGAPEEVPLECGGHVGVYLVDPATNQPFDQGCIPFERKDGMTLRDLPQLLSSRSFTVPEGKSVAVEIAVYSPPAITACPRYDEKTDGGVTIPNYFGRSEGATLTGDSPRLPVTLRCNGKAVTCGDDPLELTKVSATVTVMITDPLAAPSDEEAKDMNVRTGYLLAASSGENPAYRFNPTGELSYLPLARRWEALTRDFFFPDECVGTLVTKLGAGSTVSTLSCDGSVDRDARTASGKGYFWDRSTIDSIVAAMGLISFPDEGLVIGRVVDENGHGVDSAWVRPKGPRTNNPRILYLYHDPFFNQLALTRQGPTESHGVFVIAEATPTCCYDLIAEVERNGVVYSGESGGPIGLVDGVAMGTLIEVKRTQ